ncbi:ring-cleaving dioxygenase [Methylobacterium sp. C1]|uniref:ring-cleaving dioxygenase n=1 Tax=Methylobacterium sp. C1 TaxID=1479019 RepID=UPI0008DA8ED0|nr:ring-cleaving dioxygenase [Methylobacterium sp. C1]
MHLTGIHHVTAVTADARCNHAFYTGALGLRLVKKTVNQDDVSAYHLFYGDGQGSPGSDITFFDWPVERERRGANSVGRTSFRVGGANALDWWAGRLRELGIGHGGVVERGGRAVLDFEDPEGQRLALVDDGGVGEGHSWERSAVPAEYQIRGLGPVELCVPSLAGTSFVLCNVLGMRRRREETTPSGALHVFEMDSGGAAGELHVAVRPDLAPARPGAGGVHHLALRTPTEAQYHAWADKLAVWGVPNSGPVDRYYFRSLYFSEPNGILFEIATDGPGFATDEVAESLGERLSLPPFLEPERNRIMAGLVALPTN